MSTEQQPPAMPGDRIGNLHAFLAAHKLEVVRAAWGPGYAYPVLYVRPAAPPAIPSPAELAACAHCGHAQAVHEDKAGPCFAWECDCEVYSPPLEASQ